MISSFRQGIISCPKNGAGVPRFLLPAQSADFVTLSTPALATFAHGSSNYLQSFESTVPNAWGPLIPGVDNYLYWDIDLLTAQVSYGLTILEPISSFIEPARLNNQHWFDLSTDKMKVWSTTGKWLDRIRLFAGKAQNGNVNQLVSQQLGSQVGLNVESHAGYILFDGAQRPIRTSAGEFLTTDTPVRVKTTVGSAGILTVPLDTFIPVRAGENIPAMGVVYFSGEDTVSLASSDLTLNRKAPIVIVQNSLDVK
jgi:hypothetical protein